MNTIEVSDNRRVAVVRGPRGEQCTLCSRQPQGFSDTQLWDMQNMKFTVAPGQKNTAWKKGPLYLYVGTGPPTWWAPRLRIRRWSVMVGWLRLALAVGWGR